jgi:hypothetical protein
MPKKVENKLAKQANKEGLKGKSKQAYIYGTMNKLGMLGKSKPSPPKMVKDTDNDYE